MENAAPLPAGKSKSRALWFFLLLALVNLMWAAQGTAVKFLEGKLGPIAITFLPVLRDDAAVRPAADARAPAKPAGRSHHPRRLAPVRRRRDWAGRCWRSLA